MVKCPGSRLNVEFVTPVWSVLLPVQSVDKGITRLALQLGSVDKACCWLVNWNLTYLDHTAPSLPLSTGPLTQAIL